MDIGIAKEWVTRLRSGKYKQGKKYLHQGEEYCCLGVLCDMAVEKNVIESPVEENGYHAYETSFFGVLPEKVMLWAGMTSCNGNLFFGKTLTEMNDSGSSFTDIANVIEEKMEVL